MTRIIAYRADGLGDNPTARIFNSVRQVYVTIIDKMVRIFPIRDTLLKDLSAPNPDSKLANAWNPEVVKNLGTGFDIVLVDQRDPIVKEFQYQPLCRYSVCVLFFYKYAVCEIDFI